MTPLLALMLAAPAPTPAPAKTPPAKSPPASASPAPAAPSATPPAKPDRARIMAAVRAEWPRYDGGGKGKLTPLEFSTWVVRANGGTVAPAGAPKKTAGIAPTSAMNAAATAFARADTDHDGGITPDEMVSFLSRPQQPTALAKSRQPKPMP